MGKIKAHAGDFKDGGVHRFERNKFSLYEKGFWRGLFPKTIKAGEVAQLEQITEDNKVKVLGAAGWGVAGGVVFGPVGLLAGLVLGGRGKKVVFACHFHDGRKLLGETDMKTWTAMQAATFK